MKHGRAWAEVAVFEKGQEAEELKSFLSGHEIECRNYNDKWLQLLWFWCPPRLTFRVQVRKESYQTATDLLGGEAPAVLQKAVRCPACGSLRVNYPQMTRKFLLPTLLLHLGIFLRIFPNEAYCEVCHHIWDLSGRTPPSQTGPSKSFPFS